MASDTYKVEGTAHREFYSETGFTLDEAQEYASQIIDGDVDSTVKIIGAGERDR